MLFVSQWPRLPNGNEWWSFGVISVILLLILRRLSLPQFSFQPSTSSHASPKRSHQTVQQYARRYSVWSLWLLLGINVGSALGCLSGQRLIENIWPASLTHTQMVVAGHVIGLPEHHTHVEHPSLIPVSADAINSETTEKAFRPLHNGSSRHGSTQFLFRPQVINKAEGSHPLPLPTTPPRTLQVSANGLLAIKPGDTLCFEAQFISPRGWYNPEGHNQRLLWLRNGIQATARIKRWIPTQSCQALWQQIPKRAIWATSQWHVAMQFHRIRFAIQQRLNDLLSQHPMRPFILALTIGDTRHLTQHHWQQLKQAGIAHLMAISGLHIGLMAAFGFFIGKMIARGLNVSFLWIIRALTQDSTPFLGFGYGLMRYLPTLLALSFAIIYSGLAGMSLPTQRAVIMILGVLTARALGRRWQKRYIWFGSLIAVLWIDPLAPYFAGFWFSFLAVAGLLYYWQGLHHPRVDPRPTVVNTWWIRPIMALVKSQWVLFWVLFIPAWLWHTQPSGLSALYNIVAIPWVSFVVIPLLMLSGLLFLLQCCGWLPVNTISTPFWDATLHWSADCLQVLITLMNQGLSALPKAHLPLPNADALSLLLVALMITVILWPSSHLSVKLASLFLGAIGISVNEQPTAQMASRKITPKPALTITIFDVGQGLAVWVQTPHHQLLYDTGRGWRGFAKAAQTVIFPYIHQHAPHLANGQPSVDQLIVSHSDQDHAGGAQALLARVHFKTVLSSSQIAGHSTQPCQAGDQWQWDDAHFKMLWPSAAMLSTPYHPPLQRQKAKLFAKTNNQSCVLLIQMQGHSVLLSGDIESPAEWQLLRENAQHLPDVTPLSLLIAPHHCSHSSSSLRWVSQWRPQFVVCSVGYRNFYGHPSPKVVERYRRISNSHVWHTMSEGAIRLIWETPDVDQPTVIRERKNRRRYWLAPSKE